MRQHRIRVSVVVAALVLAAGCSAGAESSGTATTPNSDATTADAGTDTGAVANAPCEPLPDLPRGRIAYTQTREDASTALYLMKPDGTDRRCLIDTAGPDSFPAWSPDGRWLAFVGGVAGVGQVFVVRADGTRMRQVTDSPAIKEDLVWSPDGLRIGYTASVSADSGPFSIHLVDLDGSHDKTIAASRPPDVGYVALADWSPDGGTILYSADGGDGIELWTMTPEGRDKSFLREESGDFGSGAVYSPDGTSLVFQADLDGGCIYRTDARARQLVRLTQGCSAGFELSWSPDGRWIVWAGGSHGPADAEVMAADGTQRHTIVDDSSVAYTAWQPRPRD
jgi:TolB protein